MTINEYAEKVGIGVKKLLGEEYKIDVKTVLKDGGKGLTGICIWRKGERMARVFNLGQSGNGQGLWKESEVDAETHRIVNAYRYHGGVPKVYRKMDTDLQSFSNVRNRIRFKLINTERNGRLLSQVPSIQYLDFSIVFYLYIGEMYENMVRSLIHYEHMDAWHVDARMLYNMALVNMIREKPAVIRSLKEVMDDLFEVAGLSPKEAGESEGSLPFYVLSSEDGMYGAACMLYPGVIAGFAEKMGADVIILPSSIHELLLLEDTGDYEYKELVGLVRFVNNTEVPEDQILSEGAYRYDKSRMKVEKLSDNVAEKMQL